MEKNQVKIVCCDKTSKLSYMFKNEKSVWEPVSLENELSRKKYSFAKEEKQFNTIMSLILECFNTGCRGVEVFFEGEKGKFNQFLNCDTMKTQKKIISLTRVKKRVLVCGKSKSGQTELIKEMDNYLYSDYTKKNSNQNVEFYEYELKYEKEHLENMKNLIKNDYSVILFCVNESNVENGELNFLNEIKEFSPSIKVAIVYTNAIETGMDLLSEKIKKDSGFEAITTVVKTTELANGSKIKVNGIDKVCNFIFEGE